jgi:hypothetical protein
MCVAAALQAELETKRVEIIAHIQRAVKQSTVK